MKTYFIPFLALISILGGIVLYGSWNEKTYFRAIKTPDMFNTPVYETLPGPGIYKYEIGEGSTVNYLVVRRVFGQANEEVVATTTKVSGSGWFNPIDGSGFVRANVDMKDMVSDNTTRDGHVADMFSDTGIRLDAKLEGSDISFGEPFTVEVPGQITINSVTKNVVFGVSGTVDAYSLMAKGSTMLKMSDFGITPPSLVNVSTVDDDFEVGFDIKATSTN